MKGDAEMTSTTYMMLNVMVWAVWTIVIAAIVIATIIAVMHAASKILSCIDKMKKPDDNVLNYASVAGYASIVIICLIILAIAGYSFGKLAFEWLQAIPSLIGW